MKRQAVEKSLEKGRDKYSLAYDVGEVWDHIQQARIELEDVVMHNIGRRILTPWQRFAFWLMYEACQYMHDKNAQIIHDVIEAAEQAAGEEGGQT